MSKIQKSQHRIVKTNRRRIRVQPYVARPWKLRSENWLPTPTTSGPPRDGTALPPSLTCSPSILPAEQYEEMAAQLVTHAPWSAPLFFDQTVGIADMASGFVYGHANAQVPEGSSSWVEVITSVRRRRLWSTVDTACLIEEALQAGMNESFFWRAKSESLARSCSPGSAGC